MRSNLQKGLHVQQEYLHQKTLHHNTAICLFKSWCYLLKVEMESSCFFGPHILTEHIDVFVDEVSKSGILQENRSHYKVVAWTELCWKNKDRRMKQRTIPSSHQEEGHHWMNPFLVWILQSSFLHFLHRQKQLFQLCYLLILLIFSSVPSLLCYDQCRNQ